MIITITNSLIRSGKLTTPFMTRLISTALCLPVILVIHAGIGYAYITITPSLSLSSLYTDNVFFSGKEDGGDYLTILSPGLGLGVEARNFTMTASYTGRAEFYSKYKDSNQYAQYLSLFGSVPTLFRSAKGLTLNFYEYFMYAENIPAFGDYGFYGSGNEGLQTERMKLARRIDGLALSYPWTQRFSSSLTYFFHYNHYKDDTRRDSALKNWLLDFDYELSRTTDVNLSLIYGVTEYTTANEIKFRNVAFGFNHRFPAGVSMAASYGIFDIEDRERRRFGSLSLSRASRRLGASLTYTKTVGSGGGVVSQVTTTENLTGRVTSEISGASSIYLQLSYGRNKTIITDEMKINSYQIEMGGNLRITRWLTSALTYRHFVQNSKGVAGAEGQRNTVMLTFTAMATPFTMAK